MLSVVPVFTILFILADRIAPEVEETLIKAELVNTEKIITISKMAAILDFMQFFTRQF